MTTDLRATFETTFSGLEEGLRVKHIASFDLATCKSGEDVRDVLARPSLEGFDYIPVCRERAVIGLLKRASEVTDGPVDECMNPLASDIIVAGEMPLKRFLPSLAESPHFRMVILDDQVTGIVTRSDALKLPVRILSFGLVSHLEALMVQLIRIHAPDEKTWLDLLESKRQDALRAEHLIRRTASLELSLLDLTEFHERTLIARKVLGLDKKFKSDMFRIKEILRNPIAHGRSYADTMEQLREFLDMMARAEHWIEQLSSRLGHSEEAA